MKPASTDIRQSRRSWQLLRLATLACVIGLAHLRIVYGGGSVFSWLWMELGLEEGTADAIVLAGSCASVLGALALWVPRAARLGAITVVGWIVLDGIAHMLQRPPFAELTPFARATRIVAPWVTASLLALASRGPTQDNRSTSVILWTLKIGASATFAAHGAEALQLAPAFVDYVILAGKKLLGVRFAIQTVHSILIGIAVVDFVAAAVLLFSPKRRVLRAVALYMAIWGLVTAGARLVHSGWMSWDDFALRMPNAAVPAAIWLLLGGRPIGR